MKQPHFFKFSAIIALVAIVLVSTGCPFMSDYPLVDLEKTKNDKSLVGKWKYIGDDDEDIEVLEVSIEESDDGIGFNIEVTKAGSAYIEDTKEYTGYTVDFEGMSFLFCHPEGTESKGYYYYVYDFPKKKELNIYEVNEDEIDKSEIYSSSSLRVWFEDNMSKRRFKSSAMPYKKSK